MKKIHVPLGPAGLDLLVPDSVDVLSMSTPKVLADPANAVQEALTRPIDSSSLADLAKAVVAHKKRGPQEHDQQAGEGRSPAGVDRPKACIVVSDNTRPVPYSGESGILMPIVQTLLAEGFVPEDLLVLVATGTHRGMGKAELERMLDPRIFELGIEVANHDCKDDARLRKLGTTRRGSEVLINSRYLDADLKILTGLVESHFMAGASGGRKSVCPGIVGELSTYVFHGAPMMAHPMARDLVLEGNPCHEESLEVAEMAGADFIVNVTLDHSFRLTGVYAGNLRTAHEAAVAAVKSYVGIPLKSEYDIILAHAGFVGINHYQVAKVGVAALGALKKGGHLIVLADNKDAMNPVGSMPYRTTLQLLRLIGPAAFTKAIMSDDWTFIPEQWQAQMWTKVFDRIPFDHFHYFAPQLDDRHWADLPGIDGRKYLEASRRGNPGLPDAQAFFNGALDAAIASWPEGERGALKIGYLSDGPYGIPYQA
jgi:lactate racemase